MIINSYNIRQKSKNMYINKDTYMFLLRIKSNLKVLGIKLKEYVRAI